MPLSVFKTNAPPVLSQVLAWEADQDFCREPVTVLAGSGADRDLKLGTVLGKITLGAPTITPNPGNTAGSGALGSLTLGPKAKVGTYVITCVAAIANSGRFQVIDPDGVRLADALAAVAYVGSHLSFTIADATDFVVGDSFTVEIAAGSGKVIGLKLDALDGSQHAWGVLLGHVIAPDGVDAPGLAEARDAFLLSSGLVWPAGITDNQKNAALAELAGARLFTRQEA